MRPELRVVAELGNAVNFVFRFDVPVFGDTDVNADARFVRRFPIDSGIDNGFVRAVNRDASRTRARAQLAARLIFFRVKVTNPRRVFAHITHVDLANVRLACEQVCAKFGKRVPVRSRQSDTCDNDARKLVHNDSVNKAPN